MRQFFVILVFGIMALGVQAQVPYDTVTVVDPQNFTLAVTIDTALVQVISRKANANRRINFQTIKNYSTPDITLSWLGVDLEDTTGTSAAYRDFFVTDNEGEVWFVDNAGSARKLYDPAQFQAVTISNDTLYISDGNFAIIPGSSASAIDSISFYGDTLRIYEGGDTIPFAVEIISGGGVTGTGDADRITYWDTDTTLAFTAVTYSATELNAVALTGALGLPSGTTLQRPAGVAGKMRFDSDLGDLQFYNGSAWRSLPESSANAFTAGQFIIANPAGILTDTTAAGALSMMGGTSGSGASPQVAYWSGASTLTGHANFLWDGTDLSVGTTNSAYTLDMGTGGLRIGGQSAAPTGAAGVVYYDTDDNRTYYHNGTSFAPFVTGTGANTRLAYYDAAGNVTSSSTLIWDGDQLAVNSTAVEASSALVVNGNIRSRNSAGTGTGEIYLHHTREDVYVIDTDDGFSLHTNDPTTAEISFYYGNTKFANTSSTDGFQQALYTSFSESSGAAVLFKGFDVSSGDGGVPTLRGGRGSSSNNNGGNVLIYGGFNNSANFFGTYSGVPGHTIICMYSDTNATAAASFHKTAEFHSGLVSSAEFGRVQFYKYGDGARTGTPTYYSAWDTDGKFVEVSPASFGIVGAISTSTDGSGDVTVTHGMGTTPTAVIVTPTGTTPWIVSVHTIGATTFTVRFYDAAGAAVTSTAVTATWLGKT